MKIILTAILVFFVWGLLSACMMACPIPKQQSTVQQYSPQVVK